MWLASCLPSTGRLLPSNNLSKSFLRFFNLLPLHPKILSCHPVRTQTSSTGMIWWQPWEVSKLFNYNPAASPQTAASIITLLTGKVLDWDMAMWDQQSPLTTNSDYFIAEMRRVLHHPTSTRAVDNRLLRLSGHSKWMGPASLEGNIPPGLVSRTQGWANI